MEKEILDIQENFVLIDDEQKSSYPIDKVLNKVILGDCFKVIKKLHLAGQQGKVGEDLRYLNHRR